MFPFKVGYCVEIDGGPPSNIYVTRMTSDTSKVLVSFTELLPAALVVVPGLGVKYEALILRSFNHCHIPNWGGLLRVDFSFEHEDLGNGWLQLNEGP